MGAKLAVTDLASHLPGLPVLIAALGWGKRLRR